MRIVYTFILLFSSLFTFAQKKNVLNFAGAFYDNILRAETEDEGLMFSNKFGFAAGFDRLLGNRVSVGFKFIRFFGTGKSGVYYGYGSTPVPPELVNGRTDYYISDASFYERGQGFAYESKFYLEDHDHDGPTSSYICITYQRLFFKEGFVNISAQSSTTYNSISLPDVINPYVVNRIGAKWGKTVSGAMSAEAYIGAFYNFSDKKEPMSATRLANVSITLGYIFGVPF